MKLKVKEVFHKIQLLLKILDSIDQVVQSDDKKSVRIKFKKNFVIESENYAFLTEGLGVHETKQFHMNPGLRKEQLDSIHNYNFNKLNKQLAIQRIKNQKLTYIGRIKLSNDKLLKKLFLKNEDIIN